MLEHQFVTDTLTLTSSIVDSSPKPFRDIIARHGLGIAAVLTWLFTITGLVLNHILHSYETAALVAYIAAYIFGGTLATRTAIRDLIHGHVNVDLLMVVAALGAAILGQWLEGAILLGLFSTSNALEFYAMNRTRQAVRALMELTPPTARVICNGDYISIDIADVMIGDIVVVQPGERIPVDATITQGESAIDQAAITGESVPVMKRLGDEVFAGTINGNGSLLLEVTRLATDSTIARIVKLVADAQEDQSDLQEFAEGFEGKYAVFVIVFSTLATLIPMMFGVPGSDAFYRGMTLLVVLSPCALVISTPAATLSALANAARRGVLVKGGRAMDTLGRIDTVAFDKTGTLTFGRPVVSDIIAFDGNDAQQILTIAASAERLSEHPLGSAIVQAAERDGLSVPSASDLQAYPGHGITALVDGERIWIGNRRMMREAAISVSETALIHEHRASDEGKSIVYVARASVIIGLIAVADVLRPNVKTTLAELKKLGIKHTVMLTGDNHRVATAIGNQIGIDEVRAELLPADKLTQIDALRSQGIVAMLGDGVNDAPALARADIGIAMGGVGTDAALETADVVLMSDDLSRVGYAIGLSRKTRRIIKMNLTFALGVIATLATLNLLIGIPLPLGVIGHEGSTVLVILNGLRLLGYGGHWNELLHKSTGTSEGPVPQYQVIAA